MSKKFEVGHRVIVTRFKSDISPSTDMVGYYGHVAETHPLTERQHRGPMVSVSLKGRIGAAPRPHDLDLDGDDPWIFFSDEIEHAD